NLSSRGRRVFAHDSVTWRFSKGPLLMALIDCNTSKKTEMKRKFLYIIIAVFTSLLTSSCTKDFETVNVNPNVVSDVDVRLLFTSSLVPMQTSRGGEYWTEGFTHFLSACQLVTGQSYDVSTTSVNSRYKLFYT